MSASKACALNLYTTGVLDCVRKGVFIWWEFGAVNLAIQKGFGVEGGGSLLGSGALWVRCCVGDEFCCGLSPVLSPVRVIADRVASL